MSNSLVDGPGIIPKLIRRKKKSVAAPKAKMKKVTAWPIVLSGLGSNFNLLVIGSPKRAVANPIMFPISGPKMAELSTSFQENTLAKKKLIIRKGTKPAMVDTQKTLK
jgi:hypothetical protein